MKYDHFFSDNHVMVEQDDESKIESTIEPMKKMTKTDIKIL